MQQSHNKPHLQCPMLWLNRTLYCHLATFLKTRSLCLQSHEPKSRNGFLVSDKICAWHSKVCCMALQCVQCTPVPGGHTRRRRSVAHTVSPPPTVNTIVIITSSPLSACHTPILPLPLIKYFWVRCMPQIKFKFPWEIDCSVNTRYLQIVLKNFKHSKHS